MSLPGQESATVKIQKENDPNLKKQFKDIQHQKIKANDISVTSIRVDSKNKMEINTSLKSSKTLHIPFPKIKPIILTKQLINLLFPFYIIILMKIQQNYAIFIIQTNNSSLFRSNKSISRSSIIGKQQSFHSQNQSMLNFSFNSINSIRGINYDMIRPNSKSQSDTIIDKIKQIYIDIFDPESSHSQLPCHCPKLQGPVGLEGTCQIGIDWFRNAHDLSEGPSLRSTYHRLSKIVPDSKNYKQIELDIKRTVPFLAKFKEGDQKYNQLHKLLQTYSCFDSDIGYTQGMNYVASALVYHCDDWVAFWLMVHIFDKLKMRDIYIPNHYGWSKHIQIIDLLVLKTLPDLYAHLCENNIKMDMFCTPWLFSLFGMMIPIDQMGILIKNILKKGWFYIYRLILAFLVYNQELILSEDMTGIITLLSSQNYKISSNTEQDIDWEELLESAWNIDINNNFIQDMHQNYQEAEQRFRL